MLKTMDAEVIRALIKGETDIIAEEVKKEKELYDKTSCPVCYSRGCQKRIDAPKVIIQGGMPVVVSSPFVPECVLPIGYAHCIHCGTDFDPSTSVIRKTEATIIQPAEIDSDHLMKSV